MSSPASSPLYLIDGSGYLFRAYYAIRHLSSPTGFPTNAIYGVVQMLLKLLRDQKPDHLAVVFDVGRETFRTELYPDYKANRAAMPEDLRPQIEPLKELIRAFNIPVLEKAGFEADDLIGTIARRCREQGQPVIVVTGDKDLMQIVGDGITLLDTMKDKASNVAEVVEKFGVAPSRVVDVLALMGDASDNIPGVPGIGEKTASKLIQEFGSLEELLVRVDEVKGKNGERLREFADQARLSYQLATIDCAVPLEYSFDSFRVEPANNARLAELFKAYGFTSLMKELTSSATLSAEDYRCVATRKELAAMLAELTAAPAFAFDTETTSLNPLEAELVGISLACREHAAWYIPVGHTARRSSGEGLFADHAAPALLPGQLPRQEVLAALAPLLENPEHRKIAQNMKYDYQILRGAGLHPQGLWCDTMIASYVSNPARTSHGLGALSLELLDHKMISYDEVTGKGKERIGFAEVPLAEATRYSAEDADVTYLLHRLLLPKVVETGTEQLFFELEMPLVPILAEMELTGVLLDLPLLADLSSRIATDLANLEQAIHSEAGKAFNIGSPKQLGEILFEKMQLPTGKKTKLKTGWSTNVDELERLANLDIPIARLLLQYRSQSKLKSTYTDALPKLVDGKTGRVHTSYNQTVAITGRLSSSDPNLQNIPIRTDEGRQIRRAFIAPPGCKILSADYSQIELRVLAHLSGDKVFCYAFANDEDIHTRTAAEVFGLFPELVTSEMRRQAKAINFGVIYGQSAFSLAGQLGIPRKTAEEFIATYKERHAGAMAYLDSCIAHAREHGYVTTLLGRRLPIPEIASQNYNIRGYAERNAINYPIQGSAADIIKKAMINIDKRLKRDGLKSRMIMQVHDELVFEVPDAELVQMEQLVEHEMAHALPLQVPLKIDISYGNNWNEAH
jgi:DNA polymerase-1